MSLLTWCVVKDVHSLEVTLLVPGVSAESVPRVLASASSADSVAGLLMVESGCSRQMWVETIRIPPHPAEGVAPAG
jgi:hypothetical protein